MPIGHSFTSRQYAPGRRCFRPGVTQFITRAAAVLSVDTGQGQRGIVREQLSSRMRESDRHGGRVTTTAGRRLARDRRRCVTHPSDTRLGSMSTTASNHDADVCLLAQSLKTAIGRLPRFPPCAGSGDWEIRRSLRRSTLGLDRERERSAESGHRASYRIGIQVGEKARRTLRAAHCNDEPLLNQHVRAQ